MRLSVVLGRGNTLRGMTFRIGLTTLRQKTRQLLEFVEMFDRFKVDLRKVTVRGAHSAFPLLQRLGQEIVFRDRDCSRNGLGQRLSCRLWHRWWHRLGHRRWHGLLHGLRNHRLFDLVV